MIRFSLNPNLDIDTAAASFAAEGMVVISDFLASNQAEALAVDLRTRDDWVQVLNSGDTALELDRETRASIDADRQRKLESAVLNAARYGFQYRYECIRVPDGEAADRRNPSDPVLAFGTFMRSEPVIELLRHVCGSPHIVYTDAQATAYSPGDFLTAHDDDVIGKHRQAAYVYGLSPSWRPDWGGLLLFHPVGSQEGRMIVPGFNILTLFRVPQVHSVSTVAAFAPRRRYAVTGWARTQKP